MRSRPEIHLFHLSVVFSVLRNRKSFAAWKEFFFADFFALFASWRLAGPHLHREDAKDAKKNAKKTILVAAWLLRVLL